MDENVIVEEDSVSQSKEVQNRIGPGEAERMYDQAMEDQLEQAGLSYASEPWLPVYADDRLLGYYIPDLVVEEKVIVELKAFATLHQKYLGQVITYLNRAGLAVGLLINFGGRRLRWRRVFPSPQTQGRQTRQWLFVPDSLREQRQSNDA